RRRGDGVRADHPHPVASTVNRSQAARSFDPAAASGSRPSRPARAPHLSRLALENFAFMEYGVLLAVSPFLGMLPRSDGHPVLVLPGFGGGDRSTAQLRRVLRSLGHEAHGWGLGPNLGPHPYIVAGVSRRISELHEKSGRAVSLVGWSLGGTY